MSGGMGKSNNSVDCTCRRLQPAYLIAYLVMLAEIFVSLLSSLVITRSGKLRQRLDVLTNNESDGRHAINSCVTRSTFARQLLCVF